MGGNFILGALNAVKGGSSNTISIGPQQGSGGIGLFNPYAFSGRPWFKTMADYNSGKNAMTDAEYRIWLQEEQYKRSPEGQAAETAKRNALAAADIQANLVLKQAQAQQEALRMQNDTLQQDFYNVDRTAIMGLERLKNRGFDALGDAAGQAAALGISMSGTALDNQQYLNTQVMNSFTDYNSQMRTQKNQIMGQIDQNKFAIQTSQASAAIQSDSIKGLAKLQTYRPY